MNKYIYFGVDPIHLCVMSTGLNVNIPIRKRLICVPIQIGVWYILAKKYCILIGRFDATFFQSLTRLYCIPALISEATILLNWLETVLAKKYTPCQGVVWSQYRLSGTFYVQIIFGVVLFAKVCFFIPMQFWKAVHFTLALLNLICNNISWTTAPIPIIFADSNC